ncbi:hypothetical protein DFJ43DRAFT_455647 [Lentinula guzmanii]|uniref:Uncharacterized protein n=1 Tax=Lentinula guzmanii TaxID=2804957 RepID=A0AA38MYG4_9AGAR|nr:hypothetical protein DFJ43DRAFT_455647 [Lentinula guzmanii]
MSSAIKAAKNIFRFFRPGGTPHIYNSSIPPLFQRRSPWWAKWTFGLVACDAFMTGSAMDLTWNHWSEPIDGKSESEVPSHPEYYTLRPIWQRLGLCAGFFVGGVGAASALFIAGFRYTKVLDVYPHLQTIANPSRLDKSVVRKALEDRRVFIQSARHTRSRGMTFPLSQCTLHRGRADSELLLTIDNERGHWYIGLDNDSVINGQNYKGSAAREVILKAWKGGWINDDLARAASLPVPTSQKKKGGEAKNQKPPMNRPLHSE